MPSASVDALLSGAGLSTSVDVEQLLSSEYDDDDLLSTSGGDLNLSGELGASNPSTPGGPVGLSQALQKQRLELSDLEREQRQRERRDAATIQKLRSENSALKQAAAQVDQNMSAELQSYRTAVEAAHKRSRAELGELRAKLTALQAEIPALRQRLSSGKAAFAQLVIDEPRYHALRACPEEEVSLLEHVQLRVHDLLQAAERKGAVAGSSVGGYGGGSEAALSASVSSAQLQAEVAARESLSARLTEAHARGEAKNAEVEEARAEVRKMRSQLEASKSTPEGELRASLHLKEERLQSVMSASNEMKERYMEVREKASRYERLVEEANSKVSYMQQDKEHLSVQVKTLEERCNMAEGRLAKEETLSAELQVELNKAKEALVMANKEVNQEWSARMEGEQLRWMQQSKAAQDAQADAHLAALNTHKDSRELALADADKWQQRYQTLKREHDEGVLSSAEAAGRAEAGLAELRAEVRLKAFEVERLKLQCEQAYVSQRQSAVDAEARAEKLEVLKGEYYVLKSGTSTTIATLEASKRSLEERVQTYEMLEEELDRTILQSGEGGSGGGGGEGEAVAPGALVPTPFIRVPSSAQRRMQQCLGLAKDVLNAQRRAEVAEAALSQHKGEVERLSSVVNELQRKLRHTGQPQNYLAEQAETAERRKDEAEKQVGALQHKVADLSAALDEATSQKDLLLKDMESLLSQRGSLDALRATLSRLLPADVAPKLLSGAA